MSSVNKSPNLICKTQLQPDKDLVCGEIFVIDMA